MNRKKIEAVLSFSSALNQRMKNILKENRAETNHDTLTLIIGKTLEDLCYRVYICDKEGFQLSANAVCTGKEWYLHDENRHQNWSWRPYFLENIVRMNATGNGVLSEPYADIHSFDRIRTYSSPIGDGRFVFIDLPISYLNQHEFLDL